MVIKITFLIKISGTKYKRRVNLEQVVNVKIPSPIPLLWPPNTPPFLVSQSSPSVSTHEMCKWGWSQVLCQNPTPDVTFLTSLPFSTLLKQSQGWTLSRVSHQSCGETVDIISFWISTFFIDYRDYPLKLVVPPYEKSPPEIHWNTDDPSEDHVLPLRCWWRLTDSYPSTSTVPLGGVPFCLEFKWPVSTGASFVCLPSCPSVSYVGNYPCLSSFPYLVPTSSDF